MHRCCPGLEHQLTDHTDNHTLAALRRYPEIAPLTTGGKRLVNQIADSTDPYVAERNRLKIVFSCPILEPIWG